MKIYVTGKNISGTSGYLYMNVYDARKSASILGQYIQSTSIASQMSVSDSLIIPCLAIDSIYIQVYSSVGFTYEFSYLMEGNGVSDKEDNNSFATAQQIQIKDTTKGTSGYFQKGVRDNSDYFKMPLPAKGKLTLFVEGKNTINSCTCRKINFRFLFC